MAKTKCVIFYSWQSDLPNNTNRGFIEQALEKAAKAIRDDDSIQVEPVIDRDTSGVPGSPDIAKTIFNKIARAQIFVCDVSIINKNANTRLTPNPNIMGEWGYALKALGEQHVVMVQNTAYGKQEVLPFDMRPRKAIGYYLPEKPETEGITLAIVRRELESKLKTALLEILKLDDPQREMKPISLADKALSAVNAGQPNQAILVREYMVDLAKKNSLITPTVANDELDEQLVQAIKDSTGMVSEFAQLAKGITEMKADEAARAMYKGFANIIHLYTTSPEEQRVDRTFVRDLAKFLGHELFVTFFSFLIYNNCWELIAKLLDVDLYARVDDYSSPKMVSFTSIFRHDDNELLYRRKNRLKLRTKAVQADLLNELHTNGDLAKFVPMEQFMEADYFLFLRASLESETPPRWIMWIPWSTVYMEHHLARFLQESTRSTFGRQTGQTRSQVESLKGIGHATTGGRFDDGGAGFRVALLQW